MRIVQLDKVVLEDPMHFCFVEHYQSIAIAVDIANYPVVVSLDYDLVGALIARGAGG